MESTDGTRPLKASGGGDVVVNHDGDDHPELPYFFYGGKYHLEKNLSYIHNMV